MAIVDATGALMERVDYDSYGVARHRWPGDIDGDGATTSTLEINLFDALQTNSYDYDDPEYDCDLDLNRDGVADSDDYDVFDATWTGRAALASGQISNPNGPGNEIGMAGYVWSPKAGVYCVRYRYYDPLLGRWLQRDTAGYVDGLNLYTYGMGNPWAYTDPYGLWSWEEAWDTGVGMAKDGVGLFADGIAEFGDLVTGRAAREDAEHVEKVQEMEDSQKSKVCENYQNGNTTADEAAAMYNQVDGMADDLENSLEDIREDEWDMIEETAKEVAFEVGMAVATGGASLAFRAVVKGFDKAMDARRIARGMACAKCLAMGTTVLMGDLESVAIEDVSIGDVAYSESYAPMPTYGSLGFGHLAAETQSSPHPDDYLTIDPEFWRTIELEGTTESGGTVSMTLLRPEAWLPFHNVEIGSELPVYLGADIGVLPVAVVAIGPAPSDIEPGSATRGMVISTYQRTDRAVLDVYLDTDPTPLAMTSEHPVWSIDRDDWVLAGDLRPGERVETLDGVAYVLASLPAGERTVYDIEVLGDHTFYAGEQGVWVHNCHGNSLSYAGSTHVYQIKNLVTGQIYKIGQSMGKVAKSGQSYRGSSQARQLGRQTGMPHEATILDTFSNKSQALQYEKLIVGGHRGIGGPNSLPGNIFPKP